MIIKFSFHHLFTNKVCSVRPRLAASVDEVLEEDDMNFSEQLKEYLYFSDVLKWVYIKYSYTFTCLLDCINLTDN